MRCWGFESNQELKEHQNIVKLINIFYKPNKREHPTVSCSCWKSFSMLKQLKESVVWKIVAPRLVLVFEFVENDLKKCPMTMRDAGPARLTTNSRLQNSNLPEGSEGEKAPNKETPYWSVYISP